MSCLVELGCLAKLTELDCVALLGCLVGLSGLFGDLSFEVLELGVWVLEVSLGYFLLWSSC